jgi:hypothetical protein
MIFCSPFFLKLFWFFPFNLNEFLILHFPDVSRHPKNIRVALRCSGARTFLLTRDSLASSDEFPEKIQHNWSRWGAIAGRWLLLRCGVSARARQQHRKPKTPKGRMDLMLLYRGVARRPSRNLMRQLFTPRAPSFFSVKCFDLRSEVWVISLFSRESARKGKSLE